MAEEQVLVVPTALLHEIGLFQGLERNVDRYLPRLLDPHVLDFRPRSAMELDPTFKQIIPYVVLRHGDRIFHYRRGKGAGEKRLHALRSLGIGGHINPGDRASGDPYRQGLLRELKEEVRIEGAWNEQRIGLINDDSLPVGKVHLGIVHVFDLETPRVERREADLMDAGFASIDELIADRTGFETWSQFVLDHLANVRTLETKGRVER
ncbi:MAG: phosphoesterase [Gemmataceae bacterium]|nr:phosphoesterase [Gemmataceae bacterium]